MVVLGWAKPGRLNAQGARHAKMHPQPELIGEPEEHLFAMGLRAKEDRTSRYPGQQAGFVPAKDPLLSVQADPGDLLPETAVPALPIIFNFCELGHISMDSCVLFLWQTLSRSAMGCIPDFSCTTDYSAPRTRKRHELHR
jgi:hypothetical protein